jgi:hypothetical protein
VVLFGSFQIVQSRTHEYLLPAAYAKSANDLPEVGAQLDARPPLAQLGVP